MKTKKTFFKIFGVAIAVALLGASCTNVEPNPKPPTKPTSKLPVSETFENSMGTFTQFSLEGDQVWEHSTQYKYVLISGYVAQTNLANQDWLISGEIDLSGVTAAKLTFDHASRYFGNLATEATIWASEDYVSGDPTSATWTQVTTPAFKDMGNWNMVSSGEISLTPFAGKIIRIAFKYISTTTKAGTWQIKNFKVEEGEAVVAPVDNKGSLEDPYTVEETSANQTSILAWVKGYIVGGVKDDNSISTISSANEVVFGATNVRNTAVLIASSKTETDYTKCVVVNLPAGTIRDAVNLVTNATNIGKELKIKGVFRTYFGVAGVRDVVDFKLEGFSDLPIETTDPEPVTIFNENFEGFTSGTGAAFFNTQSNNKGWSGVNIQGTLQADIRSYSNNKFLQFSAHRTTGVQAGAVQEFWAISPRIDFTNATNKVLTFKTAGAYFNENTVYELYILDSDEPATATKVKIEGWRKPLSSDLPSNSQFTAFISSGDIDLSEITGVKRLGFYYKGTSGSNNSTTYQLDNIKFGE